jgi:hypothetical protein
MIRQMLALAYEAAKVEARRFAEALEEATEPPPVEQAPAPEPTQFAPPSKWSSPAFHVEALGSRVCPDCDEPKRVGAYRCPKCTRGVA